ncbi:MAG TPA: hypothetical protein VFP56_10815 [Candidatus Limnocylindrales bacterium]|nr:hypothetical protein [Candidatus Limnocylindrales bacterium]
MRQVTITLGLALSLLGCAGTGGQVRLTTVENQTCCWLSYSVVDVVADPTSGTPINKANGQPFVWAAGFTAWRVSGETEVRDAAGKVVLRTGGRYWTSPTMPDWAIGEVKTCPFCELGGGPL